jgi:RHS repeat-associated protein
LRDRSTANNGTLDERLWVQQDANWNVTALINGSGTVVERYVYDPYGLRTVLDANFNVRSSSSYAFVHGFQGLRLDTAARLYDARRRIQSPSMGRFGQTDPSGFGGGDTNLYRFEHNGTAVRLDPTGLQDNGAISIPDPDDLPGLGLPNGLPGPIPQLPPVHPGDSPYLTPMDFIVAPPTDNIVLGQGAMPVQIPSPFWFWGHVAWAFKDPGAAGSSFLVSYVPGTEIRVSTRKEFVNQVLAKLNSDRKPGKIHRIEFWGHGSPGSFAFNGCGKGEIGSDHINIESLKPDDVLAKLKPYIAPDCVIVFRSCCTFSGDPGRKFAKEAAKFFNCKVGGYLGAPFDGDTFEFGTYVELEPGNEPSWTDHTPPFRPKNKPIAPVVN